MEANLIDFIICTNCGSTDYLADYPMKGQILCGKCGHESVKMKPKVVETYRETSSNCSFCGNQGEDDDALLDTDDMIVFKCKKCGKLDGYKYAYGEADPYCHCFDDCDDSSYNRLQAKIAEKEGTYIFPASTNRKIARALQKRQNAPHEKYEKLLTLLVNEKKQIMKLAGITEEAIVEAKQQVMDAIMCQKPLTTKKHTSLFSATIMITQEKLFRRGKIPKIETTERQLQQIFGIDRKTIRKWRRVLEKNFRNIRLIVHARQKQNERAYSTIEFPKEVKTITRLDKPTKDECDFCQKIELLTWRINYVNESWSDICKSSREMIKDMAQERDWEI